MTLPALEAQAAEHGLCIMGACQTDDHPGATVILLGASSAMWASFLSSPEYSDQRANPLDRWSKRIIRTLAPGRPCIFPSDGPPYAPFIAWALKTGRFFQSPTGMMVHATAGLMISIRGAVVLPDLIPLSPPVQSPCETCEDKPCITACPVGALSDQGPYDVPACKGFIREDPAQACMTSGCATRNACPISQRFDRETAQTAFHMRAFMGATT